MGDYLILSWDTFEQYEKWRVEWQASLQKQKEDAGMAQGIVDVQPLNEPLNLDKKKVIETLNGHLTKARDERAAEAAKQKDARLAVEQFVLDHAEEVVGFIGVQLGFHGWEDLLSRLKKAFDYENGGRDYRPKAIKPTPREDSLEKFVRVLEMSTDATIEVKPTEPLYNLL